MDKWAVVACCGGECGDWLVFYPDDEYAMFANTWQEAIDYVNDQIAKEN